MLYPDMNLQKRTQQSTTRYRTALYLRLSREDGDKTESDSIANQRTLLEAYAADHPELCIVDEFVDDGYSGSNFERPAFQNLFRELEQGTINCILVKDLSRFGRNYIEVGRYLERIFPVMRVRLIAVTDNYDSQSAWKTSDSIMVPMRNLLNDAYCRDISVKIKSQLAVKRKRGDFVGSFAAYVGAKFIMPGPCKHRVLRAPLEQQVRIEDSHAAIVTPEEFEQAQMVIMLQHGKHQAGNYTKHQYPLKGKVYCGYCQKLMKYRVLKKLGPSFNCRFSATAVDSPCKRIPISEELLEEIVRNALTAQIKQAEHILEILHERERKALICFSALERQEEKLSAEKAEIVKQRVALYEQYADGNISKEEFVRQRDAYRAQEDEKMEQIQRLRTEKNQAFQPVKRDTDHLQTVISTVEEAGDVMHLSQNVVETFIDRIEVFNDERVKIHFTFEDTLNSYEEK